ncbi:Calcium-transporting ATPase [Porphyromonas macacae]|uniref:P-type Ca(2+) transporter n=2 Tax=Porphyromonas macacae TaxID=28115 RepID=A0A379DHE7_9PORP|nr:calcium-translocating P-type ATPase, PMCA-type [Porphyromonas macacae]SUB77820.1 Calcium-transporting ATPase [Porphyromonas macacae]
MEHFYSKSIEDTAKAFETNPASGLGSNKAKHLLKKYGPNKLASKKKKSAARIFFEQFKSTMVLILIIAAIISGVVGIMNNEGLLESIIIIAILIVNALIGTVQEIKARASLEALNKMSTPHTKVLRDGQVREISSVEVVPGDIVILETGDVVPADIRLTESKNLKIQESALTGESVPVEKISDPLTEEKEDIALGDRINMAFSTGLVSYGRGKGIVTATGMNTEVGHIATMLENTEETMTPMQLRLEHLGKVLGYVALGLCLIIFAVGVIYGNDWLKTFMLAVSLAVAAIPEGLQVISTMVLAMGVKRMVKMNAIVRTIPSVETLGSASVICSDKTGTLTQNKMTVLEGWYNGRFIDFKENGDIFNPKKAEKTEKQLSETEELLLSCAVQCTDAHLSMENDTIELTGDPTETALVHLGLKMGLNKNELDKSYPRVAEVPFDSERKRMTTIHKMDNVLRTYVKGGLDEILSVTTRIYHNGEVRPITSKDIEEINAANNEMASHALRVLSFAYRDPDNLPAEIHAETVEKELIFLGLLGMIDPARPEAIEAVEKCRTAGIRPIMITGDHKITAVAIAKEIGIYKEGDTALLGTDVEKLSNDELFDTCPKVSVYARVAPEHKVRIVKAWQRHGHIVAMTGDGVNDAPALKQADIGVAMGITGTEVSKGASDVILTDDNFATIVTSVQEGRRIYDNILKSIQYLLSTNVGELVLIFIASIFNLGNPLLPIHLLWINLVTDSLPALGISQDPADRNIMKRPPRDNKEGVFTKGMTWRIIYQGIMVGVLALVAYYFGYRDGGEKLGQTMAFCTVSFAQLFHVRNLHSIRKYSFQFNPLKNLWLLGGIFGSLSLMLMVLMVPGLRSAFRLVPMDTWHWFLILGLSFAPILIVNLFKMLGINSFKNEQ